MGKKFQKMNYSCFEDAMKRLNMSGPELSDAIGYERSAYNHWKHKGQMPKAAALACEALVRRSGVTKPRALVKLSKFELVEGELEFKEVYPGVYSVSIG